MDDVNDGRAGGAGAGEQGGVGGDGGVDAREGELAVEVFALGVDDDEDGIVQRRRRRRGAAEFEEGLGQRSGESGGAEDEREDGEEFHRMVRWRNECGESLADGRGGG